MANTNASVNTTIQIQIKLFATLSKYMPSGSDHYKVPAGMIAGELAAHLNLPENQMKLIFINGCKRSPNTVLQHKDRIGIFPPVGGG